VYLGDGAEVAARRFFGKNASALTLSEAATLAGFLHAPSTYTTWESGVALGPTTERRNRVLSLMEEQGMISAADHRAARTVPLKFASDPPPDPAYEPFLEKVRREIAEKLGPEDLALGGFRIHTTLDTGLQRAAVEASNDVLFAPDDPSAAVVTVEPQSGAIRALAGREGSFNLPLDARRQPGSSFKPIVLAAALREKISPESTYVFKELSFTCQERDYVVANYESVERGEISVAEAMAESDNTVFVQLAADVGLQNVVETAETLGITTPVEPYPSTAIGGLGVDVSPLDMASAYSTFPAAASTASRTRSSASSG
jgi:membrane peptidoglycan carboxypeptidase